MTAAPQIIIAMSSPLPQYIAHAMEERALEHERLAAAWRRLLALLDEAPDGNRPGEPEANISPARVPSLDQIANGPRRESGVCDRKC